MVSVRRFVLVKRLLICLGLSLALLLTACGGSLYMKTTDPRPVLAAKSNKAVLVIIRQERVFHDKFIIDNYLDGKMIGQTQSKCYFVTEVKPGMHYLTANAQNYDTALINFVAGRIYFLQQGTFQGYHAVTTRYIPMTFTEAKSQIQDAAYFSYSAANSGNDMSEKDFQNEKDKYEKEVKADPNSHKDTSQYQGYGRL